MWKSWIWFTINYFLWGRKKEKEKKKKESMKERKNEKKERKKIKLDITETVYVSFIHVSSFINFPFCRTYNRYLK